MLGRRVPGRVAHTAVSGRREGRGSAVGLSTRAEPVSFPAVRGHVAEFLFRSKVDAARGRGVGLCAHSPQRAPEQRLTPAGCWGAAACLSRNGGEEAEEPVPLLSSVSPSAPR